ALSAIFRPSALSLYVSHRDLHSFPTRRSSDLRGQSGALSVGRHREGAGELSPAGAAARVRRGNAGGSPGRLAVPGLQESAGTYGELREVLRLRLLAVLVAARDVEVTGRLHVMTLIPA